jgi:hypothetical protein
MVKLPALGGRLEFLCTQAAPDVPKLPGGKMYKTVINSPVDIDAEVNALVADGWTVINTFYCGEGEFPLDDKIVTMPLVTYILYKEPPAPPTLPARSFIGKQ